MVRLQQYSETVLQDLGPYRRQHPEHALQLE